MNKFKIYFTILLATAVLFSCQKDDPVSAAPPREYSVQYNEDIGIIEEYLETHYITVVNSQGQTDDQDVTISKITNAETQPSIKSYKSNTGDTYPQLREKTVNLHGLPYNVYYLVLRQGSRDEDSPTNTDAVFAAYSGSYLRSATDGAISATDFEEVVIPTQHLSLLNTIRGWSEIFPQFNPGSYTGKEDGTISYSDFGAGVVFIPSGLAYYNSGAGSIPSYSPLVFSFKLYTVSRLDSDGDGLPNFQEDLDDDGYMYSFLNTTLYPTNFVFPNNDERYFDDTDRDGIPNFIDIDDDGDGFSTKIELEKETDHLDKTKFPN